MIKTADGLVGYANAQLGRPYWYGTYGQISNEALLAYKKKQYPNYYNYNDFIYQYGCKVHDCVGLIKGYLWSDDVDRPAKYVKTQDVSARGMFNVSDERGVIKNMPMQNGILVYKGKNVSSIHHVGVYANGYVIEAKGHQWGVVKTKFEPNDWQFWSKCPYLNYNNTESKQYYTVVKNDNLTKISKMYNTTVENLLLLNPNIKDKNLIYVGQILRVK